MLRPRPRAPRPGTAIGWRLLRPLRLGTLPPAQGSALVVEVLHLLLLTDTVDVHDGLIVGAREVLILSACSRETATVLWDYRFEALGLIRAEADYRLWDGVSPRI